MKKVILVTDGDIVAQKAVQTACKKLGLFPIMASGGNPTPYSGPILAQFIEEAPFDPVVVMLDDRGEVGRGKGEKALEYLLRAENLKILGVIAVASNTESAKGIEVKQSIDNWGRLVKGPVNKDGKLEPAGRHFLEGDTSEILTRYPWVKVIGSGDLGKMQGHDNPAKGASITTRCLEELLSEE